MAIYSSGSVDVTIGDIQVVGNNTNFNTYVSSGFVFKVTEDSTYYEISSIVSATRLTLTASYLNSSYGSGAELTAKPYQIVMDYTLNYSLPEMSPNDTDISYIYTEAVRLIDSSLYNASVNSVVSASDIEVTATQGGVILHSPDNTAWRVTVSNAGAVETTSL
jgi:hypothetical protein